MESALSNLLQVEPAEQDQLLTGAVLGLETSDFQSVIWSKVE